MTEAKARKQAQEIDVIGRMAMQYAKSAGEAKSFAPGFRPDGN
jgi:hypothetical protein